MSGIFPTPQKDDVESYVSSRQEDPSVKTDTPRKIDEQVRVWGTKVLYPVDPNHFFGKRDLGRLTRPGTPPCAGEGILLVGTLLSPGINRGDRR